MCGPSGAQESISKSEESMATTLQQDFGSRFAGQTDTLNSLGNILNNVQQGKLVPGFSGQTLAALNTAAIDTTAGNFANAQRAANDTNAGRGGDSGLQPGTVGQENATIASSAAGQLTQEQQQIQLANQKQAEQNTAMAIGGEQTLASLQNPLGFAGATTNAQSTAFNAATQVNQENNQEEADIAGGIAGLGMSAATFGAGAAGGGGIGGGLSALTGAA